MRNIILEDKERGTEDEGPKRCFIPLGLFN